MTFEAPKVLELPTPGAQPFAESKGRFCTAPWQGQQHEKPLYCIGTCTFEVYPTKDNSILWTVGACEPDTTPEFGPTQNISSAYSIGLSLSHAPNSSMGFTHST